MKTTKLKIFTVLFFAIALNLSAYDFSDFDNSQVQNVLEFLLNSRMYESSDKAIEEVHNYYQQKKADSIQSQLSEEAKITIDNLLILAEYSYRYEKNAKDNTLKDFIMPQYENILKWNENHPASEANPYYIISSSDLINSTMQFLPQSQAIKLGLEEKANYDETRKKYPDSALAYIYSGLWYYFAPAIGGGSKSLGKDYFFTAIQNSTCNYEKYYANIYYSQACFDEKNKTECEKYLSAAEALLPGNRFTAFIKKINAAGYSYLYYSNNREKVDSKLK